MSEKSRTPSSTNPQTAPPTTPAKTSTPKTPRTPDAGSRPEEHEGGTEEETGDRRGPGAGYDDEPAQVKDTGGVV